MSSTLGGNDPAHDLTKEEKNPLEDELLQEARRFFELGRAKERRKKIAQAQEVSRPKSRAAQHH